MQPARHPATGHPAIPARRRDPGGVAGRTLQDSSAPSQTPSEPIAQAETQNRAIRMRATAAVGTALRADGDDQSMPSCLRRSATTVARTSNGWASAGGEGVTWASTAAITRQPICWPRSRFMCRYPFR
jgi:hypothetical protein